MLEFGLGFLCGFNIGVVIWLIKNQNSNTVVETPAVPVVPAVRVSKPDNRKVRQLLTTQALVEKEREVNKGLMDSGDAVV